MKKRIYITRDIPKVGIDLLREKGYMVKVNKTGKKVLRKDLYENVKGVDGIISLLNDSIDQKVIDCAGTTLKVISNFAVGFDNIDVSYAQEKSIIVTNTPCQEVNESVAEHTIGLMFALSRRIVEADYFTRKGSYKGWDPYLFLGTDVYKKTFGIVGLGEIGKCVARRLHVGFGMNIVYFDVNRDKAFEKEYGIQFLEKEALLKKSDFVSLHIPACVSTRHFIGKKELHIMKRSAFLINTARGCVVDELSLTKALLKNDIAGAALDVFECEPFIDCNPNDHYELRKLDNVILTPHIASSTQETREAMAVMAARNLIAALEQKTIPSRVV